MAPRPSYPAIPANIWWRLRERFVNAPPKGEVTRDYLSNALGLSQKNAANIMPAIRQVGLIDDTNRPTALAAKWRDDATYADACREMIDEIYPDGLTDVSPPSDLDTAAAARWFMNETRSGAPRARQLAAFYVMLAKAELNGSGDKSTRAPLQRAARASRDTAASSARGDDAAGHGSKGGGLQETPPAPTLNVAIQVYMDKGMTPEQVDQVFASMAKHLYGRG